jgi:hypothetical protein
VFKRTRLLILFWASWIQCHLHLSSINSVLILSSCLRPDFPIDLFPSLTFLGVLLICPCFLVVATSCSFVALLRVKCCSCRARACRANGPEWGCHVTICLLRTDPHRLVTSTHIYCIFKFLITSMKTHDRCWCLIFRHTSTQPTLEFPNVSEEMAKIVRRSVLMCDKCTCVWLRSRQAVCKLLPGRSVHPVLYSACRPVLEK